MCQANNKRHSDFTLKSVHKSRDFLLQCIALWLNKSPNFNDLLTCNALRMVSLPLTQQPLLACILRNTMELVPAQTGKVLARSYIVHCQSRWGRCVNLTGVLSLRPVNESSLIF